MTPRSHPGAWRWALAVATFLAFCTLIELGAALGLWAAGEHPRPLVLSLAALGARREPEPDLLGRREGGRQLQPITLSFVDPLLGYAHDPARLPEFRPFPGFGSYGNLRTPGRPRLVALGGSTTDPFCLDENWPRQLARQLDSTGQDWLVLNGGVGGFSSNQELIKLIRDALPLEPQVVVSLNGINDAGFIHSVPGHPMVHPYQRELAQHLVRESSADSPLLPNLLRLVRHGSAGRLDGVELGTASAATPAEQWWRNVRLMHAVTAELGITYVCFLQPTLGVGEYSPAERELAMLHELSPAYLPALRAFYDEARRRAAEAPYVVDLVDLFVGQTELYDDPRHPGARGNGLIAGRVLQELERRGALATREAAAPQSTRR